MRWLPTNIEFVRRLYSSLEEYLEEALPGERAVIYLGICVVVGIVGFVSVSLVSHVVSDVRYSWNIQPASTRTPGVFNNPRHWSNMTPTPTIPPTAVRLSDRSYPGDSSWRVGRLSDPTPRPLPTPTHWVKNTPVPARPTPDRGIATVEAILFGCGSLSEYEQQRIYWSMVVAQDEAERQAETQGTRPNYAMAESAVMLYFGISARQYRCIHDKGNKERWPIPSRP